MKTYIYTLVMAALLFGFSHTPAAYAAVRGDVNTDGIANAEDLALVLGAWGKCPQIAYDDSTSNSPTQPPCEADLNGDKEVNQLDVDIVKAAWTNKPVAPAGKIKKSADLSGNGSVGAEDLSVLLGAWGKCASNDCPADLNSDGIVGKADQALLLASWSSKDKPAFSPAERARLRGTAQMSLGTEANANTYRPTRTPDETRELAARKTAITQYAKTIKERLTAGALRINTLIERIDSRIEKLQAEGVDTSTSEQFITTAKNELAQARTAIASLPDSLSNTESSTLASARESITTAKQHLENARRALVSAISNLKPGINQ